MSHLIDLGLNYSAKNEQVQGGGGKIGGQGKKNKEIFEEKNSSLKTKEHINKYVHKLTKRLDPLIICRSIF